jgi:threonine synthase
VLYRCEKCDDILDIKYNYDKILENFNEEAWYERPVSVWRYRELIPVEDPTRVISLNEGGTSLQKCKRLGDMMGLKELYVKNEGENPTGSFKDRGMTVGVSKAIELGFKKVACASTGNTSASLSAYAAKGGIEALVFIPAGKIALGKLVQAMIHGAKIKKIDGNFDAALRSVIDYTDLQQGTYLLNSINPYRLEGQKTIAFEIFHQLNNQVPDIVILPVGNAGNISATWKGFLELKKLGLSKKLPRMIGIQAEGSSPITKAFKKNRENISVLSNPETLATAIRIGSPVNYKKAIRAVRSSKGTMESVSDNEILEAQSLLAKYEGLFVEPASASPIVGLKKVLDTGFVSKNEKIVCVATGHGLKDPQIILNNYSIN